MPLHDAYTRLTPYEMLIPDPDEREETYARVRREAEEGEADVSDPGAFALVGAASEAAAALTPGDDQDPLVVRRSLLLLYHGFQVWREGEWIGSVDVPATRYLVDSGTDAPWEGALPSPAGYLQLPQHLLWVRSGHDGTPESLDGFFWAEGPDETLSLLLVAGVRADRPGVSVVPLTSVPLSDAPGWAGATMRQGGGDFTTDMPGAGVEGLHELKEAGEALKLAARAFRLVEATGGGRRIDPPEVGGPPPPTRLPSRRIGLR